MIRAHEAGSLHAEGYGAPAWLGYPADVNELIPILWPANVRRGQDGAVQLAGVSVNDLAAQFGTPAYLIDEADFRSRARAFANAFNDAFMELCGGADVYYAGKAYLATEVVRWVLGEGLRVDTASAAELLVALRGGAPGSAIGLHGNNKSDLEIRRAITNDVGRIVLDSAEEVERVATIATELGTRANVMVRVTVGVEAHTHSYIATSHEDQKFGLSLATGEAERVLLAAHAQPALELLGIHSHIGSQIFDVSGFEVAARRVLGLHARMLVEHGISLPEVDLGGGFGIAYTSQHDPMSPTELALNLADIVGKECADLGVDVPRVSVEPGRAIAGPSTFTLYEVGTIKNVQLDGGGQRQYVSVDGGMSDNIRTALYAADYSCSLVSRSSQAPPRLSRVVGKHCESGDIVVMDEFLPADLQRGDLIAVPGTGAYCRSMASNYNHALRPPVVAVRDGVGRLIMRRETEDDLLALDVG